MKKTLLASLIIFSLGSCKKETPEPTPVTPVPTTFQENYVVIVGDGHTSADTFRFPHLRGGYVTGDSIDIGASDTTGYSVTSAFVGSMVFNDIPSQVGTVNLNSNASATVIISGVGYAVDAVSFTITSIGPVGGFVNGHYSGTMRSSSPPNPIVTVSGRFSVRRN